MTDTRVLTFDFLSSSVVRNLLSKLHLLLIWCGLALVLWFCQDVTHNNSQRDEAEAKAVDHNSFCVLVMVSITGSRRAKLLRMFKQGNDLSMLGWALGRTYLDNDSFSVSPIREVATASRKMARPQKTCMGLYRARSSRLSPGTRKVTKPNSHLKEETKAFVVRYHP